MLQISGDPFDLYDLFDLFDFFDPGLLNILDTRNHLFYHFWIVLMFELMYALCQRIGRIARQYRTMRLEYYFSMVIYFIHIMHSNTALSFPGLNNRFMHRMAIH